MVRSFFATCLRVAFGAVLVLPTLRCGGQSFTMSPDDGGDATSSSGSPGGSGGDGPSSSGSSGASSGSSGSSSSGEASGSSSGTGSGTSSGSSGLCPPGESWCPPCGSLPGRCAQVCPAIACPVDAGHVDATAEAGGPQDASVDGSVCPVGEHLCPTCGTGQPYCAQICPLILCVPLDASIDVVQIGQCTPPCTNGLKCCPGGIPNSYTCMMVPDGGRCLPVP